MKSLIFLALILLLTNFTICIAKTKSLSQAKKGDLYYYHKFEHKHGWAPNAHVPLKKHYSNEKELREALYKVQNSIDQLKRKFGFADRDLKREILANENELASTVASDHANNKLHGQREVALKEQINHYEKFREKYQHRFMKNKEKLEHALPDQVPEYTSLENFDKDRVNHFKQAEDGEQAKLQRVKETDMNARNLAKNKESMLEGKVGQEKASKKTLVDNYHFKIAALVAEQMQLQEMVNAEAHLDTVRRANEAREQKRAPEEA